MKPILFSVIEISKNNISILLSVSSGAEQKINELRNNSLKITFLLCNEQRVLLVTFLKKFNFVDVLPYMTILIRR